MAPRGSHEAATEGGSSTGGWGRSQACLYLLLEHLLCWTAAAVFVYGIQSAICTVVLDSSRCLFTPDRTGALLAEGQGECRRDSRCVPLNSGLGIIVISPDFILSEEFVFLWFEISYHQLFLSLPSVCSVLITLDLSSHLSPSRSIEHSGNTLGWHWKRKSCTTCYTRNVYQNWILSISTGAEFLSSAISSIVFLFQRMLAPCRGKNIDDLLKSFPVDVPGSFSTMTDFITQRASDWKGLSWKWNGLGLVWSIQNPFKEAIIFWRKLRWFSMKAHKVCVADLNPDIDDSGWV